MLTLARIKCPFIDNMNLGLTKTYAGQVEGAFMQGLGYYLTEVIEHDKTTGKLLTDGTWEYKPPSQVDIPIVFNVALLKGYLFFLSFFPSPNHPLILSPSYHLALFIKVTSINNAFSTNLFFNLLKLSN